MEEQEIVPRIDFEKEKNTPIGEMCKTKHPNNPDFVIGMAVDGELWPWPMTWEEFLEIEKSLKAKKTEKE